MSLTWTDHRGDPAAWAASLGVSRAACDLLLDADVIDLHLDLDVPVRLLGVNPTVRHPVSTRPPLGVGHTDLPRLREAGFTGVCYDLATNPARTAKGRLRTTLANVARVKAMVAAHPEDLALCRTHGDYVTAQAAGQLALFLTFQGGNAVTADPSVLSGELGTWVNRVTLVHLTSSEIGSTSSPLGRDGGLTARGRDFVAVCNDARILVDLAHASPKTFWSALDAHGSDVPAIVSHTGVSAVRPHWRNLDDDQIRAIADRGGVVGVMYQSAFLEPVWIYARRAAILRHLTHVIDLVGEDVAAIGTDYDGMIIPPRDLPDVTSHPLLVQDMLDAGWSEGRIRKVLGDNALRVIRAARP